MSVLTQETEGLLEQISYCDFRTESGIDRARQLIRKSLFPKYKKDMSLGLPSLDLSTMPIVLSALSNAIDAVRALANEHGVSPDGFSISDAMEDWGLINTAPIADIVFELAHQFGVEGSVNFNSVVSYMCDTLTEHFRAFS